MSLKKMNPEVKKLWVKDLRENPDLQGRLRLRTEHPVYGHVYCCLGRLCELAVEAGVTLRLANLSYGDGKEMSNNGYLPVSVQKWAGLERENPVIATDSTGSWEFAGTWNDVMKKTFAQIADQIELAL